MTRKLNLKPRDYSRRGLSAHSYVVVGKLASLSLLCKIWIHLFSVALYHIENFVAENNSNRLLSHGCYGSAIQVVLAQGPVRLSADTRWRCS